MRIPKHIGIIPDGNRRWAAGNGLKREDGYEHGLMPGLELVKEARKYGVEELTYYGFTMDNLKRPREQQAAFQKACVEAVKLIDSEEDADVFVIGNTRSKCFPKELLPYTEKTAHKETEHNNSRLKVNLLVNYGWEWDLNNGFQSRSIPRIQLIVRWGGMRRLSGFLPIQSVYADFYVVDELWPDFKKEHFYHALEWYQKQDVTLGG